jgi:heme/copper-type cytochrome/quinol oxidase subunit 3
MKALNPFAVSLLSTVLLLSSGATLTCAHHALNQGDRKVAIVGTAMTVLSPVVFTVVLTGLQGFEYATA